jgi:hypothetical protein
VKQTLGTLQQALRTLSARRIHAFAAFAAPRTAALSLIDPTPALNSVITSIVPQTLIAYRGTVTKVAHGNPAYRAAVENVGQRKIFMHLVFTTLNAHLDIAMRPQLEQVENVSSALMMVLTAAHLASFVKITLAMTNSVMANPSSAVRIRTGSV